MSKSRKKVEKNLDQIVMMMLEASTIQPLLIKRLQLQLLLKPKRRKRRRRRPSMEMKILLLNSNSILNLLTHQINRRTTHLLEEYLRVYKYQVEYHNILTLEQVKVLYNLLKVQLPLQLVKIISVQLVIVHLNARLDQKIPKLQ